MILTVAGAAGGMYVFYTFGRGLPDYRQLADYEPPVMTRVQAGDGRLLVEYAIQKRVFVPGSALPKLVVQAMLSAEDKNFYYHPGIDFIGVVRAMLTNVKNIATDRRLVGASTITQQVAKNFLLTSDVTMERKVKEAILAFRIERALSKDRILELYLNEIYLGFGSYGVAAAALNYFNKSLDRLTVAEAAFIAALPKAPNNYNPHKRPAAARGRRDWVIGRMLEDGVITPAQAQDAVSQPLLVSKRDETEYVQAKYYAEEVRRELVARYGEEELYKGGLSVRTTLNPQYQRIAVRALQNGLETYDRRHGWRGPINTINVSRGWLDALRLLKKPKGLGSWQLAVILSATEAGVEIGLGDGSFGTILLEDLKWGRRWLEGEKLGPRVKSATEVFQTGEVIVVEKITSGDDKSNLAGSRYTLRQIPEVEGALIAMDPHTGRVLAMVGGYDYDKSQFNRAVQARRQPGSAFKPFVYLAALDKGFTPSTLILDAPFVIDQGAGLPKWRPANYTKKFYGPSAMRIGIEKSRNLMTVRLARTIGMDKVSDYARKFGISSKMPDQLSMSLGAGETNLIKLTSAYAMLVNGGRRITPTFIDKIQDRNGRTIFRQDIRPCLECRTADQSLNKVPVIPDYREQVVDRASAYQMVRMLEGVVKRGTGRRIATLNKPLAGKTGTTNKNFDTWFIGFSPDLAFGVYVGFDNPKTLGRQDTGSNVAAPIFKRFMKIALKRMPEVPFRAPPGILHVRINTETGSLARPGDKNIITEVFKRGSVPTGASRIVDGGYAAGWMSRKQGKSWKRSLDLKGTKGIY